MSLPDLATTEAYGKKLASDLSPGEVVALSGGLGAGKTTLVKAMASELGIAPKWVSSPSYTLVNVYEGRVPVYHVDLYRLDGIEAVMQLDLDEYLFGEGICLIEWPELAFAALPRESRLLRIDFLEAPHELRRLRYWQRLPEAAVLEAFPSPQVA